MTSIHKTSLLAVAVMDLAAGGMPIVTASGVHIGGIGVSGATGDQDEECAKVALNAVKDSLK
jgi:glc operon protein GlcG